MRVRLLKRQRQERSYWERASDIVDLGGGTYGVVGQRRHQKRKPVNAWYLRMDGSGEVVSQWHEPDYVNSSGRNDGLYNIVLLPDGETWSLWDLRMMEMETANIYGHSMQKQAKRSGTLAIMSLGEDTCRDVQCS